MFFKTWRKKLLFVPHLSRLTKISMGLLLCGYLMGYQPTLNFPPVKQSQVLAAEYSQDQVIQASSFGEAIQLPHVGYISTHYSSWHPGVDIATGLGTPIRPILKGSVVEVTYSFWGLGNYVVVEHEQGIRSTYGHMGNIYVKVGDSVTQSSILGVVGLTGNTSGPHTHLEMTKNGSYINPEKLLPKLSDLPPVTYPEVAPVGGQQVIEKQATIKEENNLKLAEALLKNNK